ncbi:NEW3 domain-containing protein [Embleya scabrispora]|uniref:NEW3 domain-containing protein n=1 Tax=Embleya scabrispora TaxID=159449 RepID=UPI00039D394B|nr:NEW3 domain-containing protein [Embleya scabrispora]MYS80364.1 hypothetical protein [Streptomyces sp. SID5474]
MRRARTWSTAVGVGALALSIGMTTTVPANAADGAGTTSQGTTAQNKAAIRLSAGYLAIALDSSGTVSSLKDSRTGTDYLAPGKSASLVSLVIDGRQERPTKVSRSGDRLTFTNKKVGFRIVVKAEDRAGYSTLEAVEVEGPAGADVQTLLWGPLPTSVDQSIGQAVGVVRDNQFAIGLRPLTDRTEGAWPQEYQDFGWESEVADNPDNLQVALPHGIEEWSAAGKTPWGSVLRAFTFDYTKERARQNIDGYRIPVGPLPGRSGRIVGSKIALFGAAPEMALTVLSDIATGEHLPYPTQNGQWQKTSQASSQSFLVLGDLKTGNIPAAADFAKTAGMDYIYSLPNAVGPWQTTGHYQFNSSLGGNDAGAAQAVDIAKANGVRLGVHTISNFVSLNDAYVTPKWSPDLALGQRATSTRPLAAGDTTLYLSSCAPTAPGLLGRTLRIGSEIVTYAESSQIGNECRVTGLGRGSWGTVAAGHAIGDPVARVPQNQYGGAFGGLGILNDLSDRFSIIWNTTGIMSNSYDGLESASDSGWGAYGMAKLVNDTYAKTKAKDGFVTETSRMTSNTWDALTRSSWGEVGSTSMNQVFVNNAYYRANYLPGMLGWISLNGSDTALSLENKLARGAGLNAGVGFQTSVDSLTKGGDHAKTLLDTIKQWETTRNLGAFTEAQKARFRDQSTNWHLTVVKPGRQWSLQELDSGGKPVGTAQPVVAPTPAFTTTGLPAPTAGRLYEARVATNSPGTVRYTVTAGTLPKGLRLNPDTGGITGIPKSSKNTTVIITAKGGPGVADAQGTFTTGTLATTPGVTLSSNKTHVDRGGSLTVTASIANVGTTAMPGSTATISLPSGWTTSAATVNVGSIAAGATAKASWTLNVAADAAYGPQQTSTVSVAYTGGPGNTTASLALPPVAYPNPAAAFDNAGISDDANTTAANLDGAGLSLSAQALAASGLTPAASVAHDGVNFTWPKTTPGRPDNIVAAGQVFPVTGSGSKLGFIGTSTNGSGSGTGTITYADGTTQTYPLSFADWWANSPTNGSDTLTSLPYLNTAKQSHYGQTVSIYAATVPLQAGKTVAYVTLPNAGQMHIFATAIG